MPFKSSYPPPKIGTVYRHKYQGTVYTMVVVQTESGVGYKVGDKVFASPTEKIFDSERRQRGITPGSIKQLSPLIDAVAKLKG